jgi:hypothetical protein
MALRFPAIDLGPLPVELINAILRCALGPGIVHFSAANQDHAFERHREEFLTCLPYVAATVLDPEYIGQSPRHSEGFELVRSVGPEPPGHILVALTMQTDGGRYMVQSVYPIGSATVRRRLRTGHLFRVWQS